MFFYFARLHQKYLERIYPIVVFSFDEPYREESNHYSVEFDDWKVMEFNFRSIQLNRLSWRDYLNQPNPVAAALMSKMKIDPVDRPRVKVECLRLLATLRLDPARIKLISGFVDTYLRLNEQEEQVFQASVDTMLGREKDVVMEIVTSWMERGIVEGEQRGKLEGKRSLILHQLARRVGTLPVGVEAQIQGLDLSELEALGDALLDFTQLSDLLNWLRGN